MTYNEYINTILPRSVFSFNFPIKKVMSFWLQMVSSLWKTPPFSVLCSFLKFGGKETVVLLKTLQGRKLSDMKLKGKSKSLKKVGDQQSFLFFVLFYYYHYYFLFFYFFWKQRKSTSDGKRLGGQRKKLIIHRYYNNKTKILRHEGNKEKYSKTLKNKNKNKIRGKKMASWKWPPPLMTLLPLRKRG